MRQFLGELFEIFCLASILFLILGACHRARADSYTTAALGIFSSAKDSHAESKFFNMGYRDSLILDLSHQAEIGLWTDAAGHGRKGSGYVAYMIGVEVDNPAILARFMAGPALITSPDAYLGGVPQFTEALSLGIRDRRGRSMSAKYQHFSSAGIFQPNVGRDFGGIEVSIPW